MYPNLRVATPEDCAFGCCYVLALHTSRWTACARVRVLAFGSLVLWRRVDATLYPNAASSREKHQPLPEVFQNRKRGLRVVYVGTSTCRTCRNQTRGTHARHARASLHPVFAYLRPSARGAVRLDPAVRADLRSLAFLAVRPDAFVFADARPSALLALVPHPAVGADARAAALRALVPYPVMLAHGLASTVPALTPLPVVFADAFASALAAVVPVASSAVRAYLGLDPFFLLHAPPPRLHPEPLSLSPEVSHAFARRARARAARARVPGRRRRGTDHVCRMITSPGRVWGRGFSRPRHPQRGRHHRTGRHHRDAPALPWPATRRDANSEELQRSKVV